MLRTESIKKKSNKDEEEEGEVVEVAARKILITDAEPYNKEVVAVLGGRQKQRVSRYEPQQEYPDQQQEKERKQ